MRVEFQYDCIIFRLELEQLEQLTFEIFEKKLSSYFLRQLLRNLC